MARIRTIKPEFFTSEDIVGLSALARLLYVALWCEADKEGRMVWKPKTFKMRYLPADECDIDALCGELLAAKLVVLYGEGCAFVPSFKAHQHINPRETASQLPEPDAKVTRGSRVGTRQSRGTDTQGGREGKGREGKVNTSAQPTIPCPYEAITDLYHEKLPEMPRAMLQTDDRQKALRKLWGWVLSSVKSDGTPRATTAEEALGWIAGYFARARENDFLMGRTQRSGEHANWRCDLDFLLTERGMKHVIEKTQDKAA